MKSKNVVVLAVFLSLLLLIQPKTASAQEDIENIQVFDNPESQRETSVAVNPLDPNNIVVGANDWSPSAEEIEGYSGTQVWTGYYWSTDGGTTWGNGLIPRTSDMASQACDPALAFDNYGNVYYAGLTYEFTGAGWGGAIFVSKSTDGGETFGDPVIVDPENGDKPAIAVDTTGGEYDGNIYVTWVDWDGVKERIMFSRSTDGGNIFSDPEDISFDTYNWGPAIAVGLYGDVYVTWGRLQDGSIPSMDEIQLAVGFAGGEQFIWFGSVASVTPIPNPLPNTNQRAYGHPTIDVDRNSPLYPSNGDTAYIAWADNRYGDADILMVGVVIVRDLPPFPYIEGPYMVNDDKNPGESNGKDQFYPTLSVSSTGKIDIAFYDRRDDPDNTLIGVYYSQGTWDWSSEVPAIFTENLEVTTQPTDPDVWLGSSNGLGDYIDVVSEDGNVYVVWTDGRNGVTFPTADENGDIYIAIFPSGPAPLPGFILYVEAIVFRMLPAKRYYSEIPIWVLPIGDYSGNVFLNVTGIPAGMKVELYPPDGIPPFTSTVMIDAEIAELGTSIISIFAIGTWPTPERIASFSVEVLEGPFINLRTRYGDPGDVMTIVGQGFTPLSEINIMFDQTSIATITSDTEGSISGSFTVPETEGPTGALYTVTAIDPSGDSASASLRVPTPTEEEIEERPPPPTPVPQFGLNAVVVVSAALIIYMLAKRRKIKRK